MRLPALRARHRSLVSWIALLVATTGARADAPDDWPQFLGPQRNGVSGATGLNLDWKARPPKVRWKVPLGSGYSSLSVAGDRLVTTAKRGNRDFVVALDPDTGKEIWAYDFAASYLDVQKHAAGIRSTPTLDGDHVYCLHPMGDLVCLTVKDGKQVWKTNVLETSGAKNRVGEFFYWGLSASPLVEGDRVIVQPGGTKDNSVVAFDKRTGKMIWGVGNDPSTYASPIALTAGGKRQLVCPTGKSILGIEPASGQILWRYPFGNPRFDATCATPIWANDLLFVSAAYGVGCAAVAIEREGKGWKAVEKWANKNLLNIFATSIAWKGHLYGCHGDLAAFSLRCLDLRTGEVKWQERRSDRCSFVAAEGHLFVLGERGTLQLVEANPEKYVLKGQLADVLTFKAWAQPALAKKRLYLRDEKNAICIDLAKE
jgi:outer membrane protein assembly factor BamB